MGKCVNQSDNNSNDLIDCDGMEQKASRGETQDRAGRTIKGVIMVKSDEGG